MKYYRLVDDNEYPNRWYLGDISGVDNWSLVYDSVHIKDVLHLEIYKNGVEMDFTLTEVFGVPVVSNLVKDALLDLKDVKFIPLSLAPHSLVNKYYAMVNLASIDCVDEARSIFEKFEKNDPVRPDKAGEYRGFLVLCVDPSKIKGTNIFRLRKFETAVIVSELVRARLESVGVKGTRFLSASL